MEWFAVVTDNYKAQITNYAKSTDSVESTYFTPPEQTSPVIFNNIVTTSMTDMSNMFDAANSFNKDISSWDTSKVRFMNAMFINANVFNQDIGLWNTSSVEYMHYMFHFAYAFNQNLSGWNVGNVTYRVSFATDSPLELPANAAFLPNWVS